MKIQSILKGQGFQNIPPLLSLVTPKFSKLSAPSKLCLTEKATEEMVSS